VLNGNAVHFLIIKTSCVPYPTVPSPTLYDVPFSPNTKRYRQTTDRQQTDRTSYHKRDRTTQYGRLKTVHV